MQAIHHLYITNQSTNTAEQAERWRSASSTRTGRTHKEEGTGSRAEQEVAKTGAEGIRMCQEEAQQTAPQGANQQQKTQR